MKTPEAILEKIEELKTLGFTVDIKEKENFVFLCWKSENSWSTGVIEDEISMQSISNRLQNDIDVLKSAPHENNS